MSKNTESCKSCKFWKALSDEDFQGYCRRFPPVDIVRVSDGVSNVKSEFPLTPEYTWCGEYVKGKAK